MTPVIILAIGYVLIVVADFKWYFLDKILY